MTDSTTPAPAPAGPAQTLSLTSFIVGLAAFILGWIPVLGLLAGVAAVILGFIGRKKEPAAPKWMALVGIIAGFVAIGFSILFLVLTIILPLILVASTGVSVY